MPRRPRRDKLKDRLPHTYIQHGVARVFTLYLQPPDYSYLKDRDYTYQFEPARSQKDPVIRLVRNVIQHLNQHPEHEILMCNNNIRIVPSTKAPPIWPPSAADDNTVKFYTFFQDDHEFPATVAISVIPRSGQLTTDKVHVRAHGSWTPIEEWLLQLADKALLDKRGTQSVDYFWRKRSKKTFRLMDLPTELRLMIFELVIAPGGEVYPLSKVFKPEWSSGVTQQERENAHISLGIGYQRDYLQDGRLSYMMCGNRLALEAREKISPPNLTLLHVSKQVKYEALKAGWEGLKRCFIDHQIFTAVADSKIGAGATFNVLGRIQLSFTTKSWFKFFGIEVDPIIHRTESEYLGYYLGRLDTSAYLDIRFRDPWDGYAGDPWGEEVLSTSCQTVMIDWIMALAFSSIKHIAHIELSGYINKPQQKKWLDILKKERTEKDYHFDDEVAVKAIFDTPSDQLPPACICRKFCQCNSDSRWRWGYHYGFGRREHFWEGTLFDFEDVEAEESKPVEEEPKPIEEELQEDNSGWGNAAFISAW